jgi:hypothetical protein
MPVTLLRGLSALCAVIAAVVLVAAWLEGPPELTRVQAREATQRALEEAGVRDVEVRRRVNENTYLSSEGDEIPVWETRADVRGGMVTLYIARDDGVAVYLNDLTEGGSERLLTQRQFRRLRQVVDNPVRDEWVQRTIRLTIAAVLLVPVAAAAAVTPDPRRAAATNRPGAP